MINTQKMQKYTRRTGLDEMLRAHTHAPARALWEKLFTNHILSSPILPWQGGQRGGGGGNKSLLGDVSLFY